MKRSPLIMVLLALTLILPACSGSSETDVKIVEEIVATEAPAPTDVPPTATPEPTPTTEPVMLPVSMVSAVLGEGDYNTYKITLPGLAPLDFEESDLPAPLESVTINWFTSGGFYVAAYYGLDLASSGPLCPGNSILSGSFLYTSNAPTEEGACEGFSTLTEDPDVGPIDCHGTLFYRTAIPSNLQGTLFGTLEMLDEEGNLVGMTSQAESTTDMLEIDLVATCQ